MLLRFSTGGHLRDIELTGRRRKRKPKRGSAPGLRSDSYAREYRCRSCGHVGWSKHMDLGAKRSPDRARLLDERTQLIKRSLAAGERDAAVERRLRFVEWELDAIDRSESEKHMEKLEGIARRREELAERLERLARKKERICDKDRQTGTNR